MKYLEGLLSSSDPVQITIHHYYTSSVHAAFQKRVSEFNLTVGAAKGISVKESSKSSPAVLYNGIVSSLNNEIGSEPLPDIIQAYTDTAYAVEQKKGLADLESYFTKAELNAFVDGYLAEGRSGEGNRLKLLPIAKSTEVLVLNKKAWEAFAEAEKTVSLDDLKTMEGFLSVAEKFYSRYGKAFFARDAFANYLISGLKQLGYDIFTEDSAGNIAVCEEKAVYKKLWDYMYEPIVRGWYYMTKERSFRSDEMQNERIIAYIGSSASATYIPEEVKAAQGTLVTGQSNYENQVIILPLPVFKDGGAVAVQQGAGMSVLASTEKREYASAVFLKWLTESANNLSFAVETGYSPAKKDVSDYNTILAAINASEAYQKESIKENVRKTMEVTCEMNKSYSLYFTKGVKNGADIRDNLFGTSNFSDTAPYKQAMNYKAVADRTRIESGEPLETFLEAGNFEGWYSSFIAAVKAQLV